MNHTDSQPASRSVLILLVMATLAACVFWTPPDAFGFDSDAQTLSVRFFGDIDGLAIPDNCLTQNQKALNCWWLDVVFPAGSFFQFTHTVPGQPSAGLSYSHQPTFVGSGRVPLAHFYPVGSLSL